MAGQTGKKKVLRVAKYNFRGCNWWGAQQCPSLTKSTASLVQIYKVLAAVDRFHCKNTSSEHTVLPQHNIQVHLGSRGILITVYAINSTLLSEESPHIWPDFIQLLPFKILFVETGIQCENSFVEKRAVTGKQDAGYLN